jgi:hypothetical protein
MHLKEMRFSSEFTSPLNFRVSLLNTQNIILLIIHHLERNRYQIEINLIIKLLESNEYIKNNNYFLNFDVLPNT